MNSASIIADVLAACGAGILLYSYNQWLLGRASEKWPQAEGILDSVQIEEHEHHSRGRQTSDFTLGVRYRFVVGEKVFIGRRLRFGGPTYSSQAEAAEERSHLREEAPLVVYYDPDNPNHSSLERGVASDVYGTALFGALAIGISVFMILNQ